MRARKRNTPAQGAGQNRARWDARGSIKKLQVVQVSAAGSSVDPVRYADLE